MNAVESKNLTSRLAPVALNKITVSTHCADQASNMGGLGSVLERFNTVLALLVLRAGNLI
jgi:hypothetical protein